MSIGSMVLILIGCAVLAVLAGIVTRSIFIGILFPILLIIFIMMWRSLKKDIQPEIQNKEEEGDEGEITQEAVTDQQPPEQSPPVSTSYPPAP